MSKEPIFYGGQAVIGGVLINSPKGWSLAVRNEGGDVQRCFNKRVPIVKRNSFYGAPLIRGISALLDSLIVGYKGLDLSEKIFYSHNEVDRNIFRSIINYLFVVVVLAIFIAGPRLLIDFTEYGEIEKGLLEGLTRGLILFAYIYFLGKTEEAKELFEYHGAEHMTIAAFESEEDLLIETIKKYPKEHNRCGTSFLFLIVLISFLTLPFIPTMGIVLTAFSRVLHVFFVAMLSYEVLKINFKYENSFFSNIFAKPGLWVQKITTRNPSDEQIIVAQVSMANAIFYSSEEETNRFDKILSDAKEVDYG